MSDESSAGSDETVDRGGSPGGGPGQQSPLQARTQFLQKWSWDVVIRLNRGACERGRAQHGFNREAQETVAKLWEAERPKGLSFLELTDFLRQCHRSAPFLFFNGNTFADVGRRIGAAIFGDLPRSRLRETVSVIGHYIAGVLDRDSMIQIITALSEPALFKPGDRLKTFRGSLKGVVIRILPDDRCVWRPDGSSAELIAEPDSLLRLS